jgi:hypothetical protein
MNDLDRAELGNWLIENRESWQRVQRYIDNLIDSVAKEALDYVHDMDSGRLAELKGRLEAYEQIRDMNNTLASR